MKKALIQIGEMAKINHTTIATLRLYDQKGLLKPVYIDQKTGYRYYSIEQNARVDMIAYMKELGMNLSEIKSVLEKKDITLIENILSIKNEQLYAQIRQLKEQHHSVKRAIASIERFRKSPDTGTISLEYIDKRYAWGIGCKNNFYEGTRESYEEVLVDFKRQLLNTSLGQIHSYNIGTSVRREDYLNNQYEADKIFILSNRKFSFQSKNVFELEAGMYACIYLDNYDDEIEYGQRLLNYCQEHHYQIADDYICEVLTEFNVFDNTKRNMFMRLQVLINFSRNT